MGEGWFMTAELAGPFANFALVDVIKVEAEFDMVNFVGI